jgi:predicted small secreted protein
MKINSIVLGLLALGLLASCNTIRGAGRDVQAGGAAVEDAAADVQQDMQESQAEKEAREARERRAAEAEANPHN